MFDLLPCFLFFYFLQLVFEERSGVSDVLFHQLFRSTFKDYLSSFFSSLFSEFNQPVCRLDYVGVMLDYQDAMPQIYKLVEASVQLHYVVEVQSGRWLVEDEDCLLFVLTF